MKRIHEITTAVFFAAATAVPALAADFDVLPGGDDYKMIVLRGEIVEGDADRFYEIARGVPRATVVLESLGGAVNEGLSIAAEVRLRDYATLVLEGDGCFSMCAVIWVASNRRYMAPDAMIGAHAAFNADDRTESGVANADIGAFLNEVGLSREAIRYFTLAKPDEFNLITPQLAQLLSIDVRVQDGFDVTFEDERPTPRGLSMLGTQIGTYEMTCQRILQFEPAGIGDRAQQIVNQGYAMIGQDPMIEFNLQSLDVHQRDIQENGPVRWCLGAYMDLLDFGEITGVRGPSFDCSRAQTGSEKTICSSPPLWGFDRAVANIYGMLRQELTGEQLRKLMSDQVNWLQRRQRCGSAIDCNMSLYVSRLQELGA
jgi:hypothetical protein